jgi:hypothetical protein
MAKIKSQTAGSCEVCGEDTDISSPVVCFGCVSESIHEGAVDEVVGKVKLASGVSEEVPHGAKA